MDKFKNRIHRWTLILGVAQITFGCVVGFIPPTAVAWFRGIVMSHIEYTANGVLVVAFGLLLSEMNLGKKLLSVWFWTLQLGTWTNGTAGLVGAIIGHSSKLMPTINEKFPAPNSLNHGAVTGLLLVCGITVLVALLLTIYGLVNRTPAKS